MNVQVRDVACLFFLLYANLLVLVTLCEGNHYPFIEERYNFSSILFNIDWKMSNIARKFYNELLYRSCRRLGCIAMAAVLQSREKEGKGGEKGGFYRGK